MNYIDFINYGSVDSQTIGIIIVIPVTGVEAQPVIAKYNRCDKCERQSQNYDKFCSHCGGKIIEVTEKVKVKYGNGYETECYETEYVPIPDVRKEMNELGIENHLPFDEDYDEEANPVWKFVFKDYKTIGHRSDFIPFLEELDLKKIQADLKKAKEKFKAVIEKYNGKVVFGIAGDFADW
jgi:hypothetical protein